MFIKTKVIQQNMKNSPKNDRKSCWVKLILLLNAKFCIFKHMTLILTRCAKLSAIGTFF